MLRRKSAFLHKVKPRNLITPAEALILSPSYRFLGDMVYRDIEDHPDNKPLYDAFVEVIEVPQASAFDFDVDFKARFLDKDALKFKKLCEQYWSLRNSRHSTQALMRNPLYPELRSLIAFAEKEQGELKATHPRTWFFKMIYCPKDHGVQPLSDDAWSELVVSFENWGSNEEEDDEEDEDNDRSSFNESRLDTLKYNLHAKTNLSSMLVQNIEASFLMSETEVSQALWGLVMGEFHPYLMDGRMSTDYNYPINYVSFFDTLDFCNRLSILCGLEPCYKLEDIEYRDMSLESIYSRSSCSSFDFELVKAFKEDYWVEYLTDEDIEGLEDEGRLYPEDPTFEKIFRSIEAAKVIWDKSANGFRLPTKEEWAYAASSGIDTLYPGCSKSFTCFKDFVCFDRWIHDGNATYAEDDSGNSRLIRDSTRLDSLSSMDKANAWGFRGMSGNVSNMVWPQQATGTEDVLNKTDHNNNLVKTKGGHQRSEYIDFLIASDVMDDFSRDYFQSFRLVRNAPLDIFLK